MSGAVHSVRCAALGVLLVAPALGAEPVAGVDAEKFECAELEAMIRSRGRVSITALHVNPHSDERLTTNTFVAGPPYCTFLDEWPTQWVIRAKDGEVCTRLAICLPRDPYDNPLWGRMW